MRPCFLLLVAILASTPVIAYGAQGAQPSSSGAAPSSSADTSVADLPVSLDRIREGLSRAPAKGLLSGLDKRAHFKVEIEAERLGDILESLDIKTGPAPPGGIYAYEQQQQALSKRDRPLMQPYAAFSGGELLTLAIESLIIKYLGGRLATAVTSAERARAEEAARAEVARAIAEYCAAQPGGAAAIQLCSPGAVPR